MLTLTAHIAKTNRNASEDCVVTDSGFVAVADGVTRTPPPGVAYPAPSPAQLAALECVTIAHLEHRRSPADIAYAFRASNQAIARLNRRLGLHAKYTAGVDDLAGTVGSVAALVDRRLYWGYIGDSGVALLGSDGRVQFLTPDDIAPLRPSFPGVDIAPHRRMALVRSQFRNKAHGRGFGVLTGERHAALYIRSGSIPVPPGATAVAFTDGARPLLFDRRMRAALAGQALDAHWLHRTMLLVRSGDVNLTDEATIGILRV